jgi:dTDP-4-dehydrorhamnose 3,5-epimerase
MRFVETPLPGVWEVELDFVEDDRGWFARTFDASAFAARGLHADVVQCNASFSAKRGTLRGMHYQAEPHGEVKLVRCVRGAIFDVALDLRPRSSTYLKWHAVELTMDNHRAYYLPEGIAHGFQALSDECEVHYQMGREYVPEAAQGVRWDDPLFAIEWPAAPPGGRIISERDSRYADFVP